MKLCRLDRNSKANLRRIRVYRRYAASPLRQVLCTHAHGGQEFSSLDDDAKIYKLVGPVLLKQDTTEAKSTVDSRLQYIQGEM